MEDRLSGIYKIQNLINGHFYVGSAVDIKRRWRQHKFDLLHNDHDNIHLQRSWNLYGDKNFEFTVVEYCEKTSLVLKEQYWMDTLNPEYNIGKLATSSLGIKRRPESIEKQRQKMLGRKLTPEHKEKVRLTSTGRRHSQESIEKIKKYHNLPETKAKIHNALFGKKKSPETIAKMKFAQQNRSPETKKKLSISNLGKKLSKESIIKRTQSRLLNNGGVYTSRSKTQNE